MYGNVGMETTRTSLIILLIENVAYFHSVLAEDESELMHSNSAVSSDWKEKWRKEASYCLSMLLARGRERP